MSNDRFLLIKAWSYILWADVEHVMSQLLIAELTNRIPVVYWPTYCLHNGFVHTNGFELYFEPVSNFTIFDVAKPGYTFYPPVWDEDNLLMDDPDKDSWVYRNIGDIMSRNENVVVGDVYFDIYTLIPFINKNSPAYGMTVHEIYRYLFRKYIRIKPDINTEIQGYFNSWLKSDGSVLAVHVCKADTSQQFNLIHGQKENYKYMLKSYEKTKKDPIEKQVKVSRLPWRRSKVMEPNKPYHDEIKKYIDKYDVKTIFLLTNSEEILTEYKKKYGSMVVATDCKRIKEDDAPSALESPMIKRRRGIEIVKDTYLASMCDFFIGNDFSSLSQTVCYLKDWPDSNAKLLYWKVWKRKYPINAKIITKRESNGLFRHIAELVKKHSKKK